jgi:hypothetical protein
MSTRIKSSQKLRMEIAEVAARLIAVDGALDYHTAKRKAAIQLGLSSNKNLPANHEIEKALISYQNLFQVDTHESQLKELRKQAIQAMKMLRQFKPLLVGPVASGTAARNSEIILHLYSDQLEQIGLFLTDQGIPYSLAEKHVKINSVQSIIFPTYNFIADETSICLVVMSEKDKNLNPISSIDNKPMISANLQETIRMTDSSCSSLQ